uniref:Ig-like domain-containing protein n=1 Tax=Pygocentrus nattereri TaxID=42514 RepID=A0A3B4BKR8_PYGNA
MNWTGHVILESIPSDPVLVRPGGSFSVSCKAVGYDFGSYSMHWIRQPSGKALQWIGRIYTNTGTTAYTKGLEGRIEIMKDNSKSTSYLKLSGLTVEDTAVYYCARLAQCDKQMGRVYKNQQLSSLVMQGSVSLHPVQTILLS